MLFAQILESIFSKLSTSMGYEFERTEWAQVPNPKLGDFAIPMFKASKALKKAPPELSKEAAALISQNIKNFPAINSAASAGPYLNLFLNPPLVFNSIQNALQKTPQSFGSKNLGVGKTLSIDFSSPNIAKEMALHHLRSTAIGNALSRIAKLQGFKVERINYLGDWGTSHGKNLLGLELFGSEKELVEKGLPYLLEIYIRFNQEEAKNPELSEKAKARFALLESGEPENTRLWKLFRQTSIDEYKKLYKRLGVDFDHYDGESLYNHKLDSVVDEISKVIGTRMSEGALVCDLEGHKIPILLKKDDGASLYITRDLAAIQDRWERFHFDLNWYVVDARQSLHFKQLFDCVKALKKPYADRSEHIPFGVLRFGDKVMKSREGNIIFLNDVLDEAKNRALNIIKEKNPNLNDADQTAEMIGKAALVFSDLSQHPSKDVKFDWERALSFEGDTAPFIQYTHARCASLLKKAEQRLGEIQTTSTSSEPEFASLMAEESLRKLIREFCFFEQYCERAFKERDPSQICISLLEFSKGMNQLYHAIRFIDENDPKRLEFLIQLCRSVKFMLSHGLSLLGLEAPEEM